MAAAFARAGLQYGREHGKDRALPGPVRAQHAEDLPLSYLKRDIVHRDQVAEFPGRVIDVYCNGHGLVPGRVCCRRRRVHRFERRVEPFHARLVAELELLRIFPADGVRIDVGEAVGVDCFGEENDGTQHLIYFSDNTIG